MCSLASRSRRANVTEEFTMNRRRRAIAILVAVMALWGSTFVVTKDVIDEVPPLTLAFLRVAIGFVLLLPFAWRRRSTDVAGPVPWKAIVTMGFVGVAFYYGAFNFGLFYTSASQGALVQSSIPAVTALVAVMWLRERASRARMLGIALSIIGVLVIFSGSPSAVSSEAPAPMLGNFLVFLSVVGWGIYTSFAKRLAHVDAIVLTAGVMGIGTLLLLPAAAVELQGHPMPRLATKEYLEILFLGAGASGLAYMLYNLALQDIDASQAGVFANLIPVVGVISGILVLHEPLSARAIVGGVIVMLGVWMTAEDRRG
jgi:drug/metabolite transporter (DMT)-like permease